MTCTVTVKILIKMRFLDIKIITHAEKHIWDQPHFKHALKSVFVISGCNLLLVLLTHFDSVHVRRQEVGSECPTFSRRIVSLTNTITEL